MYFGRAINQYSYGIGVLLIASNDSYIPLPFKLRFKVSNNENEYEACIVGLEAALELGTIRLDVIEDSSLVVSQANRDWNVKVEKMKVYHQTLDVLIPRFEKLTYTHLLRENNRFADALATLSSIVDIPLGVKMHPIIIEQKYTPAYETITINKVQDKNPWYYDIWNFLENDTYPPRENAKEKRGIRRLEMRKLCVEEEESKRLMEAIHGESVEHT
ncbi:uncharacterized protein LOC114321408 [Camellia sinensis]|uniref:uncharacterized protein LOC114321408 n=1 Tax=Camellia sinensis TaxID=4442 RepID=UPI001035F963|nr:uncharacterized protein LOC114321408 [Camellia sinensis]